MSKKEGPGVITTSGLFRLRVLDTEAAIEITNVYNPKFRQLFNMMFLFFAIISLFDRNHIRNAY